MRSACATVVVALLAVLLASPASAEPSVERLAGATRYETAGAVAEALHPDGATTAVVVSGSNFPDALSAGVAAAALDAPLLLASATWAPIDELRALGVRNVVLIGGTAALPPSIASRIASAAGATVRRISGNDRYLTAKAVADETAPNATVDLEVSGDSFETALVAAVHAARIGARLLLTHDLPAGEIHVGRTRLYGDAGTLNDALLTRYPATSTTAIVTTIDSFPDALAATAMAGTLDAPVLFTRALSAGISSLGLFRKVQPTSLTVVGGTASVPEVVLQQLFGWVPLPPVVAPGAESSIARDVFARINAERAARRVPALVWDASLQLEAVAWAREMATSGFRHDSLPPGLGEDIHHPAPFCDDGACYLPTSGAVHRDWMHSSGNRDNIVEPGYVIAGVGAYCAPDGTLWAVVRFGIGFTSLSHGGTAARPVARDNTSGVTCEGKTVGAQPWWPVVDT